MKLLLIENELNLLKVWKIALERQGLAVHTASGLREARERLQADRFDTIVSDFHLDDGDINDLEEAICSTQSGAKLIVISGRSSDFMKEQIFHYPQLSFLEKPVPLSILMQTLAPPATSMSI